MAYSFDDPNAAERHTTQYFEMFCNRGIYHDGWTAVTRHSTPWLFNAELPAFPDDVWELYDTTTDWTQAHDLADRHPEKLRDLQRQFLIEATKYNVLPLDDRRVERLNNDIAGRPTLLPGSSQTLYSGMGRLNENCVLNIKNKSHAVTAEITLTDAGGSGVIVAQGGEFGGWALYLHEGRFRYCYNLFGLQRFKVEAPTPLAPGGHRVGVDFAYDGGGLGRGGTATVYVDGHPEGKGRIEGSVPMLFSADETTDVGQDNASPVSDDYTAAQSRFTGTVHWVRIDLGDDNEDHFITPEQRMAIAMSRQ
jgi:hypothetical protein